MIYVQKGKKSQRKKEFAKEKKEVYEKNRTRESARRQVE